MKQNVMNTENVIEVSGINEVQVLNMMKNVANLVTQLEVNFGEIDESDRRHDEVEKVRESLLNSMRALGVLHAIEVETNARIKADAIIETTAGAIKKAEANKK